ncbi:MAG TPA: ATP-binding cassette domain-containing protein [Hydrogenothermaceae bacterium]|nr:ATP-binding cassette domain-containing protein [Hydrogenothermaceae bacterium]HIQ50389.1 ATP-binding cassette domain-containing protein [Nautiliaceae bacterium]
MCTLSQGRDMNIDRIYIENKITGRKVVELNNIFIPESSIVGVKSDSFEDIVLFFSSIAKMTDLYPDFNFDVKIKSIYNEILYFPEYPYTQISGLTSTVYGEIALPLIERCINETNIGKKVNQFLSLYELEDFKYRNPYSLSTGELQKLLLCSQDICEPEIWLLLYPLSGLDRKNKAKIEQIFQNRKENKIIFIFDQNIEKEEFIDFILDLKKGTLSNINLHHRNKKDFELLTDYLNIKKIKENKDSELLIELQNINFSYSEKSLLKNVSLVTKEAELILITGPNGCGKTTLAKIIAGMLNPKRGKIYKNKKTDIIYIPPDPTNLFLKTKVKDEIEFILDWRKRKDKYNLNELLNIFNLKEDLDKHIYELSLEKRKYLSIFEAVLLDKNLIILDEPTSFVTENFRKFLLLHMRNSLQLGKSFIIITHDFYLIRELSL